MSKTNKVKEFLSTDTFESCSVAHKAFERESGETITYAQFNTIYRNFTPTVGEVAMTALNKSPKEREKYKTSTAADLNFPDSILVPFKSKTIIDEVLSSFKGLLPATVTIVPGESGVGKTTVLLDALGKIKKANPKSRILFVSSEMNRIHMFKYTKRVKIEGIEILYLQEYKNPYQILEDILQEGWDIVLLDSFQDTVNKLKDASGLRASQAESKLLTLMDNVRIAKNERKLYTSFVATQHMTKGAVYTGTTNIKHMTDAMLEMKWDGPKRYVEFSKNRDGDVGIKLYYDLTANGVVYDESRFNSDQAARNNQREAQEEMEKSNKIFDTFIAETKSVLTGEKDGDGFDLVAKSNKKKATK